jgi:hypothetical protein
MDQRREFALKALGAPPPRSAWDALSGRTVSELEQALPVGRSALELSRDGDTLGGQKRQSELEESKGIPDRAPGGLGGRAPKD